MSFIFEEVSDLRVDLLGRMAEYDGQPELALTDLELFLSFPKEDLEMLSLFLDQARDG